MAEPFWKTVPFGEMTNAQWESLCDGCGKCCLIKLQDADTEEIVFTDVVCHFQTRFIRVHKMALFRLRRRILAGVIMRL